MPSLVVVEPPEPIITLEEVKTQLQMPEGDEDMRLDLLIEAAQSEIEPPFGWTGRAFGRQTLELRFDSHEWLCARHYVELRYPPIVSVASIAYDPADGGAEQVVTSSDYRVLGLSSDAPARIMLAEGKCWPSIACGAERVRVRFTAGYEADDPRLVAAKQALVLMISQRRSLSRDTSIAEEDVTGVGNVKYVISPSGRNVVNDAIDRLLTRYKVLYP